MSGRGRQGGGREGRGGRGQGRGHNYSGVVPTKPIGLTSALGNHVFDYGQGAAEQMRTTWEKIAQHVGTIHGHDICNELLNKKTVVIPEVQYTEDVLIKHEDRKKRDAAARLHLRGARAAEHTALEKIVAAGEDPSAIMKLAECRNAIVEAAHQDLTELPVKLDEVEKTHYENESRTFRERKSRLEKQRGQAFSMIRGQCMQVLLDKMKHDPDWPATSESYDPLMLLRMIEKTVLSQTEDHYPHAIVYDHELGLYGSQQNTSTNEQWYERYNTKVDVGSAIGVTRQHKVLLDHAAAEIHNQKFDVLSETDQKDVREKAEEQYLAYVFLRQSGKQHNKLKVDLQNDFTTGDDRYPKNRQEVLHLLDKYSKTAVATITPSEGSTFIQEGDRDEEEHYDKEWWEDKTCYKCEKKGHPASNCPNKKKGGSKGGGKKKKDDDEKSRSSKSSKSKKTVAVRKLHKKAKKSFAMLAEKITEMEKKKGLSDSDSDAEEDSHFQFQLMQLERESHDVPGTQLERESHDVPGMQLERESHNVPGMQLERESHDVPGVQLKRESHDVPGVPFTKGTVLQQAFNFEKRNRKVLRTQNHDEGTRLDLPNVLLLDSQSQMDLFRSNSLVKKVYKASRKMRLKSNGGTMMVSHKATVAGYNQDVWFSKNAITNIISLKNLIKQYQVTYDSRDQMFVVHRDHLPDMEFKMHESGLHYYDPREQGDFVLANTVPGNKGFSQKQRKDAELAKTLYAKLGYPSIKDFKWVIQSKQFKDCPVTLKDVEAAHQIWGKHITALKGKTTRKKSIQVARDFAKVPKENSRLIGDVELPGVDGDEIETPDEIPDKNGTPQVENNDLDTTEEEAVPQPEPNPIETEPVVEETVQDDGDEVETVNNEPAQVPAPLVVQEPIEGPEEVPGVRRSKRVRIQTKPGHIPSMSGSSKEAYAVTQLESNRALNPDACMFFQEDIMHQSEPDIVAAIMTQLPLKAGLKQWGDKAKEAVHKAKEAVLLEMKQVHFRDTFKPLHWNELIHTQKVSVFESHAFLKERDSKIKGQTVAGGNKELDYISKEEVSSTVARESVLLRCIADAEEERDVAVNDIPNAFIQTRIDKEEDMAIIKIRGVLVDMLLDIAPDIYQPYVTTDKKGIKQLVGMTLDYTTRGQVKITMLDYIEEIPDAFDKAERNGGGTKTSAAPDNLFKIDEDCENETKEFHNLEANTLYATKQARPDACTTVAFLTTSVREIDKDDWTKLVHLMKCIRGMRKLPLILEAQRDGITEDIVYQDNKSAILVEKNGKASSNKCMKQDPVTGNIEKEKRLTKKRDSESKNKSLKKKRDSLVPQGQKARKQDHRSVLEEE
jgi:hypothetical protein